jgi:tellurite resistance protein
MPSHAEGLLDRVVAGIATGSAPGMPGRAEKSILTQAAASYARKPVGAESTIPTGFDPRAAAIFEAVVEASFLVANADGVFDETERQTFEQVVHQACQNTVQRADVAALVSDLLEQLEEDGLAHRIHMVSAIVSHHEHKLEVLRIAALMAQISGGVDQSELHVMQQLAGGFGLEAGSVQQALDMAQAALS